MAGRRPDDLDLAKDLVRAFGARDQLSWEHLALIRKRWKGNLVVKGILSPEDAVKCREHGVDGIMVSNHGGRQLDGSRAPFDQLAEIVDAVGDAIAVAVAVAVITITAKLAFIT